MFFNQVSSFLSFPGEAIHLATDFKELCESEFPARQVAEYLTRQNTDPNDPMGRKDIIVNTR